VRQIRLKSHAAVRRSSEEASAAGESVRTGDTVLEGLRSPVGRASIAETRVVEGDISGVEEDSNSRWLEGQ